MSKGLNDDMVHQPVVWSRFNRINPSTSLEVDNWLLWIVVRLWPTVYRPTPEVHLQCDYRTRIRSIANMHKDQSTVVTLLNPRTQLLVLGITTSIRPSRVGTARKCWLLILKNKVPKLSMVQVVERYPEAILITLIESRLVGLNPVQEKSTSSGWVIFHSSSTTSSHRLSTFTKLTPCKQQVNIYRFLAISSSNQPW